MNPSRASLVNIGFRYSMSDCSASKASLRLPGSSFIFPKPFSFQVLADICSRLLDLQDLSSLFYLGQRLVLQRSIDMDLLMDLETYTLFQVPNTMSWSPNSSSNLQLSELYTLDLYQAFHAQCCLLDHDIIAYVFGSGFRTMSDSWISAKPIIDEPSTPWLRSL